jgi:hypothetical protein
MAAQKATELRRLLAEVEANQAELLSRLTSSSAAQGPRRQPLIARVLEDFIRLTSAPVEPAPCQRPHNR